MCSCIECIGDQPEPTHDEISTAPHQVDWEAAYEEEARKFQQETLRTSELSARLREWVALHEDEHEPGPWSRNCIRCRLVAESRELLERAINVTPND